MFGQGGWKSAFVLSAGLTMAGMWSPATGAETITPEGFEHRFIAQELPNRVPWGYGVSVLADFNGNGRLDFATGVRGDNVYWFENPGDDGEWTRHTVGPFAMQSLGSTGMDVDGNGYTDIVVTGYWYHNPGPPDGEEFTRYRYDSRIDSDLHDIVTADINGDGSPNLVVLGDRDGCFWYEVPEDPLQDVDWPRHTITMDVLTDNDAIHGGFFPEGVADLTGNGYADVVMPDRWYENREQGQEWVEHPLPFGGTGPWNLSTRSWITDLNNSGRPDIVILDCDMTDSQAAWFENEGGDPPTFTRHDLPRTAEGVRGSFHSLGVADFNGNGLLDIFTAEQEDDVIFPEGATPRWFIWENQGGDPPQFEERVIFDGELGGHDARIGDITGNGRVDIITKVWKPWEGNANDGREHVSLLVNRIEGDE